jgi:hypothetical protein
VRTDAPETGDERLREALAAAEEATAVTHVWPVIASLAQRAMGS